MKINISRHHIYILLLSIFLFLFVLVFSFGLLIPEGKEYRVKRGELKKELGEYRKYKAFYDETLQTLKDLQSKNRNIITAYDRTFSPERFEKQHKAQFSSLRVTKINRIKDVEGFSVYEVNTTSHISSPTNFYDFLDAVNKGDWIIGVNFPIGFLRDGEMIKSSFTMKVYANNKDKNSTASTSSDK
ncbi:hypothetical protein [Sulfurimonas paralvinellae]|uniref:Uncharacterized protein n=1 Tax=Sulfurimonas paralvinellae TaxID=317658 RepID=A0A7M1B642_9BACT|nr:hypothetical protein [Sulfurimonas paralvinellae]QOP45130.1 hypothetical protein FM071_01990 [Sulfurimonas paralvinellae]